MNLAVGMGIALRVQSTPNWQVGQWTVADFKQELGPWNAHGFIFLVPSDSNNYLEELDKAAAIADRMRQNVNH